MTTTTATPFVKTTARKTTKTSTTTTSDPMAQKPETRLRSKIVKAIHDYYPDTHVEHPHGSQYSAGMLDLVGCHESVYFAFEVKTPQNKKGATDLQRATMESIRKAGGVAEVIQSVEEALEVLDGI